MNKPIIFDSKIKKLEDIKKEYQISNLIDTYKDQLEDLFLIRNPKYKFDKSYKKEFDLFIAEHSEGNSLEECGRWVYFPWNNLLVHYLDDILHQEIRTARNKNLITKEEQEKLYNFSVGIAGLSVGSHGATTLALLGCSRLIKLADPDIISPSNLNRMRFDFTHIGMSKSEAIGQYIYQLNPYADIRIYSDGLSNNNLGDFLDDLDVLVEELDDIEVKLKIREEARNRKLPVIMATDNGDSVIIDIERFDINQNLPLFHGNLEGFDIKEIQSSPKKLYEAMARIIDLSKVPSRVLHSVLEVGRTIYSWPQLATAATLSGSVIAYVIKKIALEEEIKSGKLEVNLDFILDPKYDEKDQAREKDMKKFLETLSSMP